MSSKLRVAAIGAWLLVAAYYFYQYALRSAPSVMMPQLTEASEAARPQCVLRNHR
jgi:type VI protein secretion system component VasF